VGTSIPKGFDLNSVLGLTTVILAAADESPGRLALYAREIGKSMRTDTRSVFMT
jgi:hypothetical protein